MMQITAQAPVTTDGVYAGPSSRSIAWCPGANFGCSPPAEFSSQFAAISTASGDAHQNESGLFVLLRAATGQANTWGPSTSYAAGDYVENAKNLYVATTSGISAASGGPTGTGSGIADGTCVWDYAGPSYANGKNGVNSNVVGKAGAGKLWNFTGGVLLEAGWDGKFAAGIETSVMNFSADAAPYGDTTLFSAYLGGQNGFPITACLAIAPEVFPGGTYGSHLGIWINGANAIKDNNIYFTNTGAINGVYSSATFANAFIADASAANYGLDLAGAYGLFALRLRGHVGTQDEASSPVLSNCGDDPSLEGNDTKGVITVGSNGAGVFGGTLTFASSYPSAPVAVLTPGLYGARVNVLPTATGFSFSSPDNLAGSKIYYFVIH